MTDQDQDPVAVQSDLSSEIEASLASVWARFVGARPTGVEMQLDGCFVRRILPGGTEPFERAMSEPAEATEDAQPHQSVGSYERAASRAVAKATRRRVSAAIHKRDAKTGIATETFILEPVRTKY